MDNLNIQLKRNLDGIQFEKSAKINEAIKLYEKNIEENFDGNHPYDSLANIYRANKDIKNEIRVLEKAIFVFENIVYSERSDRILKLKRFRKRLDEAKSLL